jgi:hypothetical protein
VEKFFARYFDDGMPVEIDTLPGASDELATPDQIAQACSRNDLSATMHEEYTDRLVGRAYADGSWWA